MMEGVEFHAYFYFENQPGYFLQRDFTKVAQPNLEGIGSKKNIA